MKHITKHLFDEWYTKKKEVKGSEKSSTQHPIIPAFKNKKKNHV